MKSILSSRPRLLVSAKRSLLLCASTAALGLLATNSHALIVTSLAGSFAFGPDDLDYTQSANLSTYAGPAALVGVRIELSGAVACSLFASNSRDEAGTVTIMQEDVSLSITGLPSASLTSAMPTLTIPSFTLAANATQTFNLSSSIPLSFVELSSFADLALYDVSMGAAATIPFQFKASEGFFLGKLGSGISGGSSATASGLVKIYYTVDEDLLPPPPVPVPEISTAWSAGCLALLGSIALIRSSRRNLS